jgi:hypothetical protein
MVIARPVAPILRRRMRTVICTLVGVAATVPVADVDTAATPGPSPNADRRVVSGGRQ